MNNGKRPKLLILGLDGATLDVIRPLVSLGDLPNMAEMLRNGASGELRAVLPPMTAPSWSSFYTATNPGKHGVFDMRYRVPGEYRFAPVNSTFLRRPTFWSILDGLGLRVGAFNIPLGYPVRPLTNGLVAAGLMSPPHADSLVEPEGFAKSLRDSVPNYTPWPAQLALGHDNESDYLKTSRNLIDAQFDAMEHAMQWLGKWDLFFGVVQFPDQIFHWFWKNDDPGHPGHSGVPDEQKGVVRACHIQLDSRLGRLRELAGPDVVTMVLSDHGNGPLRREVFMDNLLVATGWTRFKRSPQTTVKRVLRRFGATPGAGLKVGHKLRLGPLIRRALRFRRPLVEAALAAAFVSNRDIDWRRTRAYAHGSWGMVSLNLKGREPSGCVDPGDYVRVRAEVIDDLKRIENPEDGGALFASVQSRDELYDGPEIDRAPDILVLPADETVHPNALVPFASGGWFAPPVSSESGWHRQQGILLIEGPGVRSGTLSGLRIEDAGATVLAFLTGSLPPEVDGRPIHAAFEAPLLRPEGMGALPGAEPLLSSEPYTAEEQQEIDRRLSSLGY
jgi:predicted AlkP superfamily phosphohydrolase/phosphomutase